MLALYILGTKRFLKIFFYLILQVAIFFFLNAKYFLIIIKFHASFSLAY